MRITLVDQGQLTYRGITITIKRRFVNGQPDDWGYKTSNKISGIGQAGYADAVERAKEAIDLLAEKDAQTS